jgi:DNA repair exonuclease SbcCD ATPase subunit
MTTVEFIEKQLGKAQNNLDKQKLRKGIQQVEIDALAEKVKHYEVIKSALKKQIPKKPNIHGYREGREINTISYTCPICNKHIGRESFCKHCGQALDLGGW